MFVIAHDGEDFESLWRRFKRGVEASGILREARRRRHFVSAQDERREKIRRARRRAARVAA